MDTAPDLVEELNRRLRQLGYDDSEARATHGEGFDATISGSLVTEMTGPVGALLNLVRSLPRRDDLSEWGEAASDEPDVAR